MAQPYTSPCDDGLIRAQPCPRETGREIETSRKRWVLAACVLASSMAFIDGSALTVALPDLRADFDASLQGVQWVLNAYVLALAALTLIGGAVADVYGRAQTLIVGCVLFAAASIACALAPNLEALIAARLAQGIGAAIMTPASLALIGEVYPQEERGAAIGVWASASALTTAGGPLLGGWLTVIFGWEAVFWINPPIALLAVGILTRKAPPGLRKPARMDWLGAGLLAAALTTLAMGLAGLSPGEAAHVPGGEDLGSAPSSPLIYLGLTITLLAALVWQQHRSEHPMLSPELFSAAGFAWLNIATLLLYAGLSIMFFLLPFELIDARGLSATEAGMALLPFTLAVGVLSRFTGGLGDQFGARPVMVMGAILAGTGHLALAAFTQLGLVWGVLVPVGIMGLGFASLIAPLTASVMASVPEEDTGLASGINNTAARIAQLLGIAGGAAIATGAAGFAVGNTIAAVLCLLGGAAFLRIRSA